MQFMKENSEIKRGDIVKVSDIALSECGFEPHIGGELYRPYVIIVGVGDKTATGVGLVPDGRYEVTGDFQVMEFPIGEIRQVVDYDAALDQVLAEKEFVCSCPRE